MRELQARGDVRLLVTSRPIPAATDYLQGDPQLEVRASEEDIKCFVAAQIPHLPRCIKLDETLKNAVQTKIVEVVDGMFLLARLHIDSLLDKRTKRKVESTLNKFSKGSAALEHAYGEAIRRIESQMEDDRLLARRVICLISLAKRLLKTEELCCALAIEPGDKDLDSDNICDIEDVISVCAGLVTVDKKSNILRLTHYTTQEYFEQRWSAWNPSAEEELAAACLTYLLFDVFKKENYANNNLYRQEQRRTEYPFFDYSLDYWIRHVQPIQHSCHTSELALAFLCNEVLVDSVFQANSEASFDYQYGSEDHLVSGSGLHLAVGYGLFHITKMLLERKSGDGEVYINATDFDIRTPLLLAVKKGDDAIVKLLLNTGRVDVNAKDINGWTPLLRATSKRHTVIIKLLLNTGKVDVDTKDRNGWTPLSRAAGEGQNTIVRLLLNTGKVDVNLKNFGGCTPLLRAAREGHDNIVRLLLDTGKVDVNSKDFGGWTLLSIAAREGYNNVVKLLLNTRRVDVNAKDINGWTPLLRATSKRHAVIIKLLLNTGKVDINTKDRYGSTPLSRAAEKGHNATVKLLLDTGRGNIDINAKDYLGRTSLALAAQRGHEAVVKLLLNTGKVDISINSIDNGGWTGLLWATLGGYEAVVKLLLDTGKVDISLADRRGQAPLLWAVKGGHRAIVNLLLSAASSPFQKCPDPPPSRSSFT